MILIFDFAPTETKRQKTEEDEEMHGMIYFIICSLIPNPAIHNFDTLQRKRQPQLRHLLLQHLPQSDLFKIS